MDIAYFIENAQKAYRSMENPQISEADFIADFIRAEVEPVRPGQWRRTGRIFDGFIEIQCSECEETHLFDLIRLETAARYCPYCGVKWDGGADNGE